MKIRIKSKPVIMTEEQRLILEGRRDRIIDKYAAQGVLKMALRYLANMDEKFNYKHFAWMAKQYARLWNQLPEDEKADIAANGVKGRPARAQELNDLVSSVSEFNKFKDLLTKKDINQYATLEELIDGIKTDVYDKRVAKARKERGSNPKTAALIDANDAAVIYEDEVYFIIRPGTTAASCYFGAKTRWCIAQEGNNYFYQYTDIDKKLFFFIKNDTLKEDNRLSKTALQVSYEEGEAVFETIWDRYDDPTDLDDVTTAEELAAALQRVVRMPASSATAAAAQIVSNIEENPPEFSEQKTLREAQDEADEIANQASRASRWDFEIDVNEEETWGGNQFIIENVKLTVFSAIPEQVNLKDEDTLEKLRDILPNFSDTYSLSFYNNDIVPDSMFVYRNPDGSGFLKLVYAGLNYELSSFGSNIVFDNLVGDLNELVEVMQLGNVTDPFMDGSFNDATRDLCAMLGVLDDETWYLSQIANSPIDHNSWWQLEATALDYTPSNNEYVTEAVYISTIDIDTGKFIQAGATPQQAAALFLSIGSNPELQNWIVREINKHSQESNGGTFNGQVIPFSISTPEYYDTMDKIAEDDYDIEDSFKIKIDVTNEEIDTLEKKEALKQLIASYYPDDLTMIITQSPLFSNLLQGGTPSEPVTEHKKRMMVRMLRGK